MKNLVEAEKCFQHKEHYFVQQMISMYSELGSVLHHC